MVCLLSFPILFIIPHLSLDISALSSLNEASYDHIVAVHIQENSFTQAIVFEYFRILKPDGVLHIAENASGRSFEHSSSVKKFLTLSGFTSTSIGDFAGFVEVCHLEDMEYAY